MKLIDLLNKIANGEEVPKKIKVNNIIFEYRGDDYLYKDEDKKEYWLFSDGYTDKFEWLDSALNTKVEILEEEKKIPEKINWKPKESMAGQLTQKDQIEVIARRTEKLKKEFNNLLDYLKSKGE